MPDEVRVRRFVCRACALANGGRPPANLAPTWTVATCDWCNEETRVLPAHEFGDPLPPAQKVAVGPDNV